ncbi:histamine N-methyltransferase-like [Glandiceps talaboti]
MMASQMTSLLSSPTHYLQSQVAYLSLTDRAEKVYELCSAEIPQEIISGAKGDIEQFHYLGVGSGSGEADIKVLIQLKKRYPRIKATIMEPSPALISNFKENITKVGSALEGVEFEWKTMTFEEYMEGDDNNQCFHCIILIGVTAYFEDIEQAMKDLYKILVKNGTIVITNDSEKNVFDAIRKKFPTHLFGHKRVPTDKVVAVFNEIGASVRVSDMEASIDITLCLQKDSEIGNLILDILTHVLNFRETAPEDLFRDVFQVLQDPELLSRKRNDSVFIYDNKDVIIVQKA